MSRQFGWDDYNLQELRKSMPDQNGMSRFDRVVGRVAGMVFWAVIGSLCFVLKLFYRSQPRFKRSDVEASNVVPAHPAQENLNVQQHTII